MFLGTSSGSVGDVTMYRRDGQQVSRVRVRQVANPQSSKQVYTRAILSTISKAYAAGKSIFDHSFEGEQVPAGAQRYFLRENLKTLRALVASDRDQNLEGALSNPLVGKNAPNPVVGQYIVSHGSLFNNLVTITPGDPDDVGSFTVGSAYGTSETWGAFVDALGLVAGDIYTFVFFAYGQTQAMIAGNYVAEFGFVRLTVKQLTEEQLATTTAPAFSDIFDVDFSGNVASQTLAFGTNQPTAIVMHSGRLIQSIACIRSREDSGKRSSEQMVFMYGDDIAGTDGTYWANVYDRWTAGTPLGESALILEGGGFPVGAG